MLEMEELECPLIRLAAHAQNAQAALVEHHTMTSTICPSG
mgnify:CR=1 FL=1